MEAERLSTLRCLPHFDVILEKVRVRDAVSGKPLESHLKATCEGVSIKYYYTLLCSKK